MGHYAACDPKRILQPRNDEKIHFLSNEENVKWIEDYVERETSVARKRVEDAEEVIRQEQADKGTAENAGVMTR